MTRFSVRLSGRASEQLSEVVSYIGREGSSDAAMRWLDEFERVVESLVVMPRRFPLARESERFAHGELRQAPVFRHRLLFTIDGSVVRVLSVRHSAQQDQTRFL